MNFEVKKLKLEYEQIKSLSIGEVSQIMYVNVHLSYCYFNNLIVIKKIPRPSLSLTIFHLIQLLKKKRDIVKLNHYLNSVD